MRKHTFTSIVMSMICFFTANAVTFNVTVPTNTKKCFVVGDFNGWDAGNAIEMTLSGENTYSLTLENVSTTDIAAGYKYLCGRDWAYVEKDATGGEINNRTEISSMDVVESWAKLYNPDIIETQLNVNGYDRIVKIFLPSDYSSTSKSYPVVYLTGVQARYNNAGDDSDRGDDHFGEKSWNIPRLAYNTEGGIPCIFVSMYGFVAENIPYKYEDFAGSGNADEFISAIETTLIPYINSNYRTLTDAENTSIAGADMGGLLSVYAALKRPDLFGQCASISPTIWINKEQIIELVNTIDIPDSQRFYLSVGSAEPKEFINDVVDLKDAIASKENVNIRFSTFTGATHNDEAWGTALKNIYPFLLSPDAPIIEDTPTNDFANTQYSLVSAVDSQSLTFDSDSKFTYITDFVADGTEVPAQVTITEIPADIKTQYYWNVSRSADGTGNMLKTTNGNIGFSSKKTNTTWHRIVVFEDETVKDIAANSKAFYLITADKQITMDIVGNYTVKATAEFSGNDKSFVIKFGSVNSGSVQSELTQSLSVSDNCLSAEITYDFFTNKVTIIEKGNSDNTDDDNTNTGNFSSTQYSLVSAVDSQSLTFDSDSKFTYITDFVADGTEVPAQVTITEIPADIKTQYYWNVSRSADGTGNMLKATNGNIGFSSKKTNTTWHRIVVFEDETVKDIAANSKAFYLITADKQITMDIVGNYTVKATAEFSGNDKSFVIKFGSVNSGSVQSELTQSLSVSDNCLSAEITYDFFTNKVTINEIKQGESIRDVVIDQFIAIPSICNVGTDAKVLLNIPNIMGTTPTVSITYNYTNEITREFTSNENGTYSIELTDLQAGIYHLSLNLNNSDTTEKGIKTIAIKVVEGTDKNKFIVNPYATINWSTINQYKSNFHTHTTQSFDANLRTDETVDLYYKAGYKILALTEHDANPYPWEWFNLYNTEAEKRIPSDMQMLAIPGNELSKSYNNSWNEVGGSEFNHHNDFFTGRQGQEFATLRESYAYTQKLGGMQLINHPGQYWNLDKNYTAGEKNSPEWHAENFMTYNSLIGLEVYNQGNRRPNDRILWDQILDITTPHGTNVWGYSCDDSHNTEQLFRNYNFMLMPELTIDALKVAMKDGTHYFSYEYTGTGEAKAPRITNITVDEGLRTISIESNTTEIYWISSTDISDYNTPSTRKSTIVGVGKEFNYSGFQGNYVRALIVNKYGETCTQPFMFKEDIGVNIDKIENGSDIVIYPNPADDILNIKSSTQVESIKIYDMLGQCIKNIKGNYNTINVSDMSSGHYIINIEFPDSTTHIQKLIIK